MGGRGLRCRKSGSLGEPRSGRQDCSPGHGWGALAWGGLKVAPRGSVGGLGSLGRTTWKSDRLGALCRRQPSPVVRGECSGTEEPEDRNRDRTGCITTRDPSARHTGKYQTKHCPTLGLCDHHSGHLTPLHNTLTATSGSLHESRGTEGLSNLSKATQL